ncbi:hypothetical protein HDV00_008880, partial [Rhizophlyctis rosea]
MSIPDYTTLNALFPSTQLLRPITSEGSEEEGTRLLNSFALKFWYRLRIPLNYVMAAWQVYVIIKVRRQETGALRLNMKWGMILGVVVWTI